MHERGNGRSIKMRCVCCVWVAEGRPSVCRSTGKEGWRAEKKKKVEPPDETGKRYPGGARVGDHSDNPLSFFFFSLSLSLFFFVCARVCVALSWHFPLTRVWLPHSRQWDPRWALFRSNQPDCLALIVSRFVWEVRAPES